MPVPYCDVKIQFKMIRTAKFYIQPIFLEHTELECFGNFTAAHTGFALVHNTAGFKAPVAHENIPADFSFSW